MDDIKSIYKKRKTIYLGLIASIFAIVIVFRLTAPADGQQANQTNLVKFACLVAIILVARNVFRCPKCNVALASAFYSSWCKLRYCPKCGVELKNSNSDTTPPP
jgi:phage FluMu protein Com